MPPKRKRNDESAADAAAPSTRATRSTARTSNSGAPSTSRSTTKKTKEEDEDQLESEATRPAKKTKNTKVSTKTTTSTTKTTKTTAAKKTAASSSRAAEQKSGAEKHTKSDDDVVVQNGTFEKQATTSTTINESSSPTKMHRSLPRPTPNEPYSPERAQALFKKYEDSDEPNTIGADGFSRLCNDAEIAMEGALPLILAWQFETKEMMKITAEEWRKGTGSLKISNLPALNRATCDLEDLLILDKPVPSKKSKKDAYDKTAFWKYSEDRKASFNELYAFCFALVKPPQSKNIDMETATALWSVLLVPRYSLMGELVAFIGDNPTVYRAANKDLWSMMLEFCETVSPNLSHYESDGAWPTLCDNFVTWKKGQSANAVSSA